MNKREQRKFEADAQEKEAPIREWAKTLPVVDGKYSGILTALHFRNDGAKVGMIPLERYEWQLQGGRRVAITVRALALALPHLMWRRDDQLFAGPFMAIIEGYCPDSDSIMANVATE